MTRMLATAVVMMSLVTKLATTIIGMVASAIGPLGQCLQ